MGGNCCWLPLIDLCFSSFSVPFCFFYKNEKTGTLDFTSVPAILGAGDERIELPPKVLETPIIPFDQSPLFYKNDVSDTPFIILTYIT